MRSKFADRKANGVDSDQTAPFGAVWSESTLFAQTCLSQYLFLWYFNVKKGFHTCKFSVIISNQSNVNK